MNLFAQVDGQIDSTFGNNGLSISNFPHFVQSSSLNIDNQNRIITAGSASIGNDYDFGATRFNANGLIDSSFSSFGNFIYNSGIKDFCNAISIQSDNKIILGGYSLYDDNINDSYTEFKFIRLKENGQLDSTFNDSGIVKLRYMNVNTGALAMALQSDGKIIAVGNYIDGNSIRFGVIRILTDGRIDSTFADNGLMIIELSSSAIDDRPTCIKIQNDNKILIGGYSYGTPNQGRIFCLIRINSNGTLDSTFGINGIIKTDIIGYPNDYASSLEIQNDGKIILAGSSFNSKIMAICRYEMDGTLDNTFGNLGIDTLDISSGNDVIKDITIQSDGKIIIAGIVNNAACLIRLNTYGNIDSTFNNTGIKLIDNSITNGFYAIKKQIGSRYLTLGSKIESGQLQEFSLVAFNSLLFSGINDKDTSYAALKIYPNPANETINLTNIQPNTTIIITNITGNLILKSTLNPNQEINLSHLASGLYFMQIHNAKSTQAVKFIKK
jgi:uncharacterized delta-60 repeat protein